MAQTPTSPKIEELRFKLKTDPKSRHFYPLAEELRKIGQHEEAEKILLEGLEKHPAYLSAWIGLGRVLKDANRHREAIESFQKGLVIDPGNLVAARLIAESYLALGEKVEAIKKFKLVNALMPGDEEIEANIEALEKELNAPPSAEVEQLPVESAPPPESFSSGSEAASAVLETSPAEVEQLLSDSPPVEERQDDLSDPDTQQPDSFRFQGSDESSEDDSGLAMTREAGVSPPDEDIFESAARVDDEPGFGAPSTGGAMAFDEGAGGMSVLETHADDDTEDTSDIFAASLEVPAPPMDDSPETLAGEAETADGPWIDDEPQQPVNLHAAPSSYGESDDFGAPAGDVPSSDSAAEHDFVVPAVSDTAEAVASSIEEESNEGAPEAVDASDREPGGVARNDAMIRKLRDWELRLSRREGG